MMQLSTSVSSPLPFLHIAPRLSPSSLLPHFFFPIPFSLCCTLTFYVVLPKCLFSSSSSIQSSPISSLSHFPSFSRFHFVISKYLAPYFPLSSLSLKSLSLRPFPLFSLHILHSVIPKFPRPLFLDHYLHMLHLFIQKSLPLYYFSPLHLVRSFISYYVPSRPSFSAFFSSPPVSSVIPQNVPFRPSFSPLFTCFHAFAVFPVVSSRPQALPLFQVSLRLYSAFLVGYSSIPILCVFLFYLRL